MYSVELKNISFKYEKEKFLEDISFSINEKEFFIIIGPNGSGKTTLLKIIANLLKPLNGNVFISGKKTYDYTNKLLSKKISFVTHKTFSDVPFTVEEFVLLGRFPHINTMFGFETKEDINIANASMEYFDVFKLKDKKIKELSSGEQKRVSIARAFCQKSEIMLLDEPTNTLDIFHKMKIMNLMKSLKKNITIVMVLHDINLASMYADRILLMKKGKIEKIGEAKDIVKKDILERVYNCSLFVDKSPFGDYNRVTLLK